MYSIHATYTLSCCSQELLLRMIDVLVDPMSDGYGLDSAAAPEAVGLNMASKPGLRCYVLTQVYPFRSNAAVQAYVWEHVMPLLPQWFQQIVEQEHVPYRSPEAVGLYTLYLSKLHNLPKLA